MSGYQTKQERVTIAGVDDLVIRLLLDKQQFWDPHGEAERLGISSAMWPLFGMLWPSGAHLAARVALRPPRAGERILEIGCGLALASLVAHRRGADVTASDCHPLAETFLLENLRLNGLAPLKYRCGHWSDPQAVPTAPLTSATACAVEGRFDLIMASDVLYERDANATLARFITRHSSPDAEVWIVDPDRGNRPAFNRQMAAEGFGMNEERLSSEATDDAPAYKGRLLVYRRNLSGVTDASSPSPCGPATG